MKTHLIGRRDFVKNDFGRLRRALLAGIRGQGAGDEERRFKGKERKFVYRTLGKTGLKLPVINMGVMNSDNPNLIRAALDSAWCSWTRPMATWADETRRPSEV